MKHKYGLQSLNILVFLLTTFTLVAQQPQVVIDSVIGPEDAIRINYSEQNGIHINYAGTGVFVNSTANSGVTIFNAGYDGVLVNYADVDGVYVANAGDDGVHVFRANGHSLNIQGDKSDNTLAGHIGLIYNRNASNNADVLALKAEIDTPGGANNFVTYYNGDDQILGQVQGNGSGAVCFTTGGCDYAEYLPVLDTAETFSPGDLVGVYEGNISKKTLHAHQVMVITDQAAMIGNQPVTQKDNEEIIGYQTVSFIGQVRAKVWGIVQAGDWIVASGSGDGTGVAVTSEDIQQDHQIVGRAWESSSDPSIKRINTAVGLDHSQVWTDQIQLQQNQIEIFKGQIDALRQMILDMKKETMKLN